MFLTKINNIYCISNFSSYGQRPEKNVLTIAHQDTHPLGTAHAGQDARGARGLGSGTAFGHCISIHDIAQGEGGGVVE